MLQTMLTISDAVPGLNKMTGSSDGLRWALGKLDTMQASLNSTQVETKQTTKAAAVEFEDSKKKTDKYGEAVDALADKLSGKALAGEIAKTDAALKRLGGETKLNAASTADLVKEIDGWLAKGAAVPESLLNIWRRQQNLNAEVRVGAAAFLEAAGAAGKYAGKIQDVIPPLAAVGSTDLAKLLDFGKITPEQMNVPLPAEMAAKAFRKNFANVMQVDLPKAIMGAIQGGGSVVQAAGSTLGGFLVSKEGFGDKIGAGLKKMLPDGLSTAISSMLPGVGALVGPLVNKIVSFFGSAGRDAVVKFADSMGGFDALHAKLNTLGAAGETLWIKLTQGVGKNNPEQAKQVIQEITSALAENESVLEGLVPSWSDAVDIATKYGGTIADLGPKFEQMQFSAGAEQLVVDFKKLIAAGADVNGVIGFMGDEFQDVVSKALKFGFEVPEAMRPVLESMMAQGKLTDENGVKLESLSKIKFAESMTQGFDRIVAKLDELIGKLAGGVGKAADVAADQARKAFEDLQFDIPVKFSVSDPGAPGGNGEAARSGGSGARASSSFASEVAASFGRRVAGVASIGASAIVSAGPRGGDGGSAVVNELRALRASQSRAAAAQADVIARAVRDGLMLAGI